MESLLEGVSILGWGLDAGGGVAGVRGVGEREREVKGAISPTLVGGGAQLRSDD